VRQDLVDQVPRIEKDSDGDLYSVLAFCNDPYPIRRVTSLITDVRRRLAALERAKIDFQIISPVPSLLFYDRPFDTALTLSKAQNDGIAQTVSDNTVFAGLCSIPLQEPENALPELERAIRVLGLKGVEIGTNVNGRNLDDRSFWPFYAKVQDLGIPIMVHPHNVAASDRLQKYYLSNLIGNPLDTSIAIASVIFGGVLEDFPNLKFLFVHAGGFTPYQRGRLDHGFAVRPEPKANISKIPSHYLPLIYVDTITHYGPALEYLIKTMGASNVLLGSDFPFDMGPDDPVGDLQRTRMSAQDRKKISMENAKQLFRLN
jgi:aminocarboxymuconate-semialdehyde decarboxylase